MKGNDQDWDRMWPEKDQPLKEGDSIEGLYVQKVENYGSNHSNVYILEVGDERIGVWGSTVIDEHMKDVALETEVGIEYAGMAKSQKSGKEYKKFIVGVANDAILASPDEDLPQSEPPF
jgi:hypothetical protein